MPLDTFAELGMEQLFAPDAQTKKLKSANFEKLCDILPASKFKIDDQLVKSSKGSLTLCTPFEREGPPNDGQVGDILDLVDHVQSQRGQTWRLWQVCGPTQRYVAGTFVLQVTETKGVGAAENIQSVA